MSTNTLLQLIEIMLKINTISMADIILRYKVSPWKLKGDLMSLVILWNT